MSAQDESIVVSVRDQTLTKRAWQVCYHGAEADWPDALPVVGVVYVRKSTMAALPHTLSTFPYPLIIVHMGAVKRNTVVDTFLRAVCELDVTQSQQRRPMTLWHRSQPTSGVVGVVSLRIPLAPELAMEYVFNNVMRKVNFQHVIVMESGIGFRSADDVDWLAEQARDTASVCTIEPAHSHEYGMIGQRMSYYSSLWYKGFQERPRALQEHWTSTTDASLFPLLCLAKQSTNETVMRTLAAAYHPLDSGFGSLASLHPTRLINRGQFKTRLAPGMSCTLDVLPNDRHVCNMIMDRPDWFSEWCRPFLRVAWTLWFGWIQVCAFFSEGARRKLPKRRYGACYSFASSFVAFWLNVVECSINLMDLFLPSVMVVFWLDLIPFVVPLASWASDSLLIAHAFVLRTTVVSWSDVKPWAQAWIHYLIMAFYLLLDLSTAVVLILVWALGSLDQHYECLIYSLGIRLIVSIVDSARVGSFSLLRANTWLANLVVQPWIVRTSPVQSLLHLPRKLVPFARQGRRMYTLQESLLRNKTLDWYLAFRTWTVVIWSLANASMLSLNRFLTGYGEYTQRFPAKVFAYGLAVMHLWAALWMLSDWVRCWSMRLEQKELEFEPVVAIKGTKTNPVEAKVSRLLRRPYEQRVVGVLAATQGVTQSTTTEQVGSTHRQVQTLVVVGTRMEQMLQ